MAKKTGKHIEVDANVDRDDLALLLHDALNKSNKDGSKVSYFLDDEDNPTEVVEWLSTGSTMLDLAVSNRPHGGLPVGRMVELSGLEGTGKSLICAQLIAETQRRGGQAVFFDSEFSVDKNFWIALGVNIRNVNYVPFTTLEEFFNKFELCVGTFRKKCPDRLLTIFVDSVAQASVEAEMESDHGVRGFNTGKSQIISAAMRKCTGLIACQRILPVFTNQLRHNMNSGPYGDKWVTPGGKALPYACSVRIRLANLGKLRNPTTKEVFGMDVQAQVIKNRCGPNYRTAAFEIHYDSGVQDLKSWIDYMKENGIITGDGRSGFTYKRTSSDEKIKFTLPEFVSLMNTDAILKEEVYQSICNNYVMKYRDPNSKIVEEVEHTDNDSDDISTKDVSENEG